jgi:hypothetical protein
VAATTLLPALLTGGCNPYERKSGEYLAGSVDPVKFPAAYLGDGGDPKFPGGGTFTFVSAHAGKADMGKNVVSYYPLPFTGNQQNSDDPLDVGGFTLPLTYVFDPLATSDGAANDSARCIKPDGYVYDDVERREQPVRRDRQGNVFTQLPASAAYVPVVREVVVTSNGNRCQDIKSEATLLQRTDVKVSLAPPTDPTPDAPPLARPSGRLLAMAIIDPAADVQFADPEQPHDATTNLGPQRWGFYGQYLLAYLDGGYIPQQIVYGAGAPEGSRRLVTQDLYFPVVFVDAQGKTHQQDGPGLGLDVLQFRRGEDGYSPVCRVRAFVPQDPTKPETAVADIDPASVIETGQYIYCLQLP